MPSKITVKVVNGTTFTRIYAWDTVRIKDNEPQRSEEIRTLCRQLTRLSSAEYLYHYKQDDGTTYFTVDGVASRAFNEDDLVVELRKQLHTLLNK